jgi:hypothetical protein
MSEVVQFIPRRAAFTSSWFGECEAQAAEWIVEGLIPARAYALIYGRRSAAKSFLAIELVHRLAFGGKFFGRQCEKLGSIYFVGEKKAGFSKRVRAWRQEANRTEAPVLYVWGSPNLLSPESLEETIAFINGLKPEFERRGVALGAVVFDTIARAVQGADPSKDEVAGSAVEGIQRIIDECAVTAIPLGHMAKAKDADTAKGSTQWEDAADTVIRIERDEGSRVRRATVTKQGDGEDGVEFAFELDVIDVGLSEKGKPITSCVCVPVDVGSPAARPRKRRALTAPQQLVMAAVTYVTEHGETQPLPMTVQGSKAWMKAVTVAAVRARAEASGLSSDSDKPNTRNVRFNRALEAVLAARYARKEGGLIWLV